MRTSVCVCLRVWICACVCACASACLFVFVYVGACECVCVFACAYMYVVLGRLSVFVSARMCMDMRVCICVYVCARVGSGAFECLFTRVRELSIGYTYSYLFYSIPLIYAHVS